MSEPISDARLAELIAMASNVPDLHSALLELQERRKAEGERKKDFCIAWEWGSHPQDGTQRAIAKDQEAALRAVRASESSTVRVQERFAAGEWKDL